MSSTYDEIAAERMRFKAICHAVRRTEQAMHVSQVDACLMLPHVPPKQDANYWRGFRYCRPSDHGYEYSMAIGDAWSVKYPVMRLVPLAQRPYTRTTHQTSETHPEQYEQHWRGGTAYNYGIGAAHYPVPALWSCERYLHNGNPTRRDDGPPQGLSTVKAHHVMRRDD